MQLLKMIEELSHIIGYLQGYWYQQSPTQATLIRKLLEMRETLRRVYEAMGSEAEV